MYLIWKWKDTALYQDAQNFSEVLQINQEASYSIHIPQLLKPFPSAKSRPQGWGTSSSDSWSSGIDGSSWVGRVSKELRVPELEEDWLVLWDPLEEELVPLCDCCAPWDCCASLPVSRDMLTSKRTFKKPNYYSKVKFTNIHTPYY